MKQDNGYCPWIAYWLSFGEWLADRHVCLFLVRYLEIRSRRRATNTVAILHVKHEQMRTERYFIPHSVVSNGTRRSEMDLR